MLYLTEMGLSARFATAHKARVAKR